MTMARTIENDGRIGLDTSGRLLALNGYTAGPTDGKTAVVASSPGRMALFDHFHGSALSTDWTYTEGTDTATAANAVAGSVLTLTGGDSAGTVAADAAMVNSSLIYKAANGDMSCIFKVKLAVITNVAAFIGFTDTLSLEMPIQSAASADTLTTNATDAVGLMFDTSMSTDHWWATGVANDTDATAVDIGTAPTAATFEVFQIDVTTAGVATFYRNGVAVAKVSGAVTPTVALTPVMIVWPRTASAGKTLEFDYAGCSGNEA